MKLRKARLRINKEQLLIFLLVLPQLKPESIDYILPLLDSLFNIGRIVSFGIIVILYGITKRKPSKIAYTIILLQLWIPQMIQYSQPQGLQAPLM